MGYAIKKIKLDSKGYPEIHYLESATYGDPECKLAGTTKSEKLTEALQKLLKLGMAWAKLGADWLESGQVTGVSLKQIEGDLGCVIILRGDFSDDVTGDGYVVNVTTPYLNPDRLTTKEHMLLTDACNEAENYLKGQPVQMSLVA